MGAVNGISFVDVRALIQCSPHNPFASPSASFVISNCGRPALRDPLHHRKKVLYGSDLDSPAAK